MKDKFLIYVHGLNSGKASIKWKSLKNEFDDSEIIEWDNDESFNIDKILDEIEKIQRRISKKFESIHLVGDSTGANIVMQYQRKRKLGITHISLISPLINRNQILIDKSLFHEKVFSSLEDFDEPYESLVIRSSKDIVLNQRSSLTRSKVITGNGTHQLPISIKLLTEKISLHSYTLYI